MKATLEIKIYHYLDTLVNSVPLEWKRFYETILMSARRPRMSVLFSQFFQPGDLVFDIGANVGQLSFLFLNLGARVVAVEPQPICATTLQKRYGSRPQMKILNVGVAERPGLLPFYVSSKTSVTSTFSTHFIQHSRYARRVWDSMIQVPVTTLDEIIEKQGTPAFIKIDTEGFERNVLAGLSQPVRAISFEFIREMNEEYQNCLEQLATLGNYRFNYARFQDYVLASKEWLTARQLIRAISSDWTPYLCGDIYCRLG